MWNGRRFCIEWDGKGLSLGLLLGWGGRFRFILLTPFPPLISRGLLRWGGWVYRFQPGGLSRASRDKAEKKFHLMLHAFSSVRLLLSLVSGAPKRVFKNLSLMLRGGSVAVSFVNLLVAVWVRL